MSPDEMSKTQVSLLRRISSIVSSDRTLDEMLGELISLAVHVTDCDACLVYLVDAETDEIVLQASMVPHASELGKLRMRLGEGVTGWVAEHNSVVVLDSQAHTDSRFKRFPTLIEDNYEAFLSVPLVSSGEAIGVLNIHHRDSYQHSPEQVSLICFIGEQMGGAIMKAELAAEKIRLLEETDELKRQLEARKLIERAKGILQHRYQLSEEQAYLRLRNESRRMRRPMKELAEAVILSEELTRRQEAGEMETLSTAG